MEDFLKIAVLADIHGNLTALKAVLNKIEELKIDKIVVAGDLISDCPSPCEVLDILKARKFICIKGNRENYILDNQLNSQWNYYNQMSSILWTKNQLNPEYMDWLCNLPDTYVLNLNQKDPIRIVHGSPDNVYELLYKDEKERLIEVLDSIDEKVLICGHSHTPWFITISDKLIVNPGSVGVSFNKVISADFAVLTWTQNRWDVEHFSEPYNFFELQKKFIESGLWQAADVWSKLILQSLKDGKNHNAEFLKKAKDIMYNEGIELDQYIPNNIWEKAKSQYIIYEK